MARANEGGPSLLFRFLVDNRLLFYVGGLIAISMPLGLVWLFGVELPPGARTAIVTVSFGIILLTYLAERRVGLERVHATDDRAREPYSARFRAIVFLAIVGIAVGIYLLLERDPIVGLLFLAGALLFFQQAYRVERDRSEVE